MSKLRKSLYLSVSGKYAVLIIDTVMVVVISRLLTPGEIGVYSLCAVILGFAGIIRNSGLPDYLIQEKELTTARQRSCFGAMVIVSWTIGAMLVLFRHGIADHFNEPAIAVLILIMVIEYFLSPIGINARAMLRREFNFGLLLKIDLTGSLIKAVVSIALALYGLSYYSLAIGSVFGFLSTVILILFVQRKDFNFIPGFSEIKHVMRFGFPSLGTGISLYLDRYGAEFIIASSLGFAPVALFNRAMSLRSLFEQMIFAGISPMLMPAFSEAHRNKADVGKMYNDMLNLLLAVAWPFFAVLSLSALPVLRLFFGDQWDAAEELVVILCLAGSVWIITSLVPTLLKSTGKVVVLFKAQIVMTVFKLVLLIAAGTQGIAYIAWAYVVASLFNVAFHLYLLNEYCAIPWGGIFRSNLKNALLTVVTVAPSLLLINSYLAQQNSNILLLGSVACISAAAWLCSIYALKHPIAKEVTLIFARMARRGSSAA